jgi:hypothetical protein
VDRGPGLTLGAVPVAPAGTAAPGRALGWRLAFAVAAAAGAASIALAPAYADPDLVLLMRFMAVVKAAMALGALAAIDWRLRRGDVTAGMATVYGASGVMLAASPGLIFSLAHVIAGAMLFHTGLFLFIAAAWRDRGAYRMLAVRH